MIRAHEWLLVVPTRRATKWHLWLGVDLVSVCTHVNRRVQELRARPPTHPFPVCQECRCYAQRNNIKLPRWANRKATT